MKNKLSTQKIILIIITLLILAVPVSFIAAQKLAIRAGKPTTTIAVSADQKYATIAPEISCDVYLRNCVRPQPNKPFLLRTGANMIVSIPEEITSGPWVLYEQFYDGKKVLPPISQYHSPGPATAIVVHTDHHHKLVTLEIHVASIVGNGQGQYLSRAFWYVPIAPEHTPEPVAKHAHP